MNGFRVISDRPIGMKNGYVELETFSKILQLLFLIRDSLRRAIFGSVAAVSKMANHLLVLGSSDSVLAQARYCNALPAVQGAVLQIMACSRVSLPWIGCETPPVTSSEIPTLALV